MTVPLADEAVAEYTLLDNRYLGASLRDGRVDAGSALRPHLESPVAALCSGNGLYDRELPTRMNTAAHTGSTPPTSTSVSRRCSD